MGFVNFGADARRVALAQKIEIGSKAWLAGGSDYRKPRLLDADSGWLSRIDNHDHARAVICNLFTRLQMFYESDGDPVIVRVATGTGAARPRGWAPQYPWDLGDGSVSYEYPNQPTIIVHGPQLSNYSLNLAMVLAGLAWEYRAETGFMGIRTDASVLAREGLRYATNALAGQLLCATRVDSDFEIGRVMHFISRIHTIHDRTPSQLEAFSNWIENAVLPHFETGAGVVLKGPANEKRYFSMANIAYNIPPLNEIINNLPGKYGARLHVALMRFCGMLMRCANDEGTFRPVASVKLSDVPKIEKPDDLARFVIFNDKAFSNSDDGGELPIVAYRAFRVADALGFAGALARANRLLERFAAAPRFKKWLADADGHPI